jgi:hypothetical protein
MMVVHRPVANRASTPPTVTAKGSVATVRAVPRVVSRNLVSVVCIRNVRMPWPQ